MKQKTEKWYTILVQVIVPVLLAGSGLVSCFNEEFTMTRIEKSFEIRLDYPRQLIYNKRLKCANYLLAVLYDVNFASLKRILFTKKKGCNGTYFR